MSMGGGGTTTSYSNQNTNQNGTVNMGPWQPQQAFVQQGFNNASQLLGSNPLQPYGGQINAQWSPALVQGMNDITGIASGGTPLINQAGGFVNDQLSGKYLSPNSNPYLAGMEQAAADPVIRQYQTATAPQTASVSEMANRYGSGSANQMMNQNQLALGQSLGNLANNFYGNAYNQGVQNMFGAAGMTPQLTQASYIPGQMESMVGQQQQQLSQEALDRQRAAYYQNQLLPWQTGQMYQGLVGGNYGQSGTTQNSGSMWGQQSTPYFSNPLGSIFGGLLAGAGTAGQLGWNPFGVGAAGAGAGAGGQIAGDLLGLGGMLGV